MVLIGAAVALSIEYWFELKGGAAICRTDACKTVGEYVRLGRANLVLGGAAFFWVMVLVVGAARFIARQWLWHLAGLLLLGAMAFDGGLLGYQLVGLQMVCWLCVGVGAGLFLSAAGLAWVRRSALVLLLALAVWVGGFAANTVLDIRTHPPELEQTAFIHKPAERGGGSLRLYLFFSLHCAHCSEVLFNLALNRPDSAEWYLCGLDDNPGDLAKLTAARRGSGNGTNPYRRVLRAKAGRLEPAESVSREVRQGVEKAKKFLSMRGYESIPLLVAKEKDPAKEVVVSGTRDIATYLWEKDLIRKWVRAPSHR
jgi:uncharacterized membrane protein